MIISDVMTKNPIYVTPEMSATDAKALMLKENISKLPVLDKNSRLVGIITKNDLSKAGPSAATTLDMYEMSYLLSKLKVEKIMTKKVTSVSPDEVVEEAARIMSDKGIGCLPVMQDDVMVGIVTESDLFDQFVKMFGARHHGVRMMLEFNEKPGELAKVVCAIAEIGGNIVSSVTSEGPDVSKRCCTIKVTGVKKADVEKILQPVGVKIVDIREN